MFFSPCRRALEDRYGFDEADGWDERRMPPGPQGGNGPGPGGPIRAASFQEYPDRYPRYAEGGGGRDPYGRKGGVDGGGQDEYQALRQRYDEEY